jgi:hypothetical protein
MLRLTPESNRVGLRSLDLNCNAGFGDSIMAFVGRSLQLKIICIGHETFTQTANHMTIRGKVPAREHGLQLIDRGIELFDQSVEFIVIDHRHLTPPTRVAL